MNPTVPLACGPLRCEIAAPLGGSIAGLWFADCPVLRSKPSGALTDVRRAGCYPLVPFSNRIGQATLVSNGTSHPLVRNFAPEPHAIHGMGWHPYFVKHPDSHVQFRAGGRWEMGADNLPSHRMASQGLDAGCAQLVVDHCFDSWQGEVPLRDSRMAVRITSSLHHLVLYTDATRDFIAIEPVSHVNNAINMAHTDAQRQDQFGLHILQPGESLSASMRIEPGPAT